MSIREALIGVVALVMMAPPTIGANGNLKYALECGAAKSTPPDNDPDPIYDENSCNRPGYICRALCCQRRNLYSQ
jgi:hypothetical protein